MIQFRSDLYKLIPANAHCAEVGCAEGFFSADMMRWGIERLYLVDAWSEIKGQKGDGGFPQEWHDKNLNAALERLQEFGTKAVFLRGLSKDMCDHVPDNSLDLVYLDADHSYEGVMSDLINWFPKLKVGGVMASHDYINTAYGVKKAFADFTKDKYIVHVMPEHKGEDAGAYFIKTIT